MAAVGPPGDLDRMLKAMTLKDLRVQLRARGLTPAGGQEALTMRLKDNMLESKDYALKNENGDDLPTVTVTAGLASSDMASGKLQNNYSRPGGQNVGNILTDRTSSRVLAPPGGGSQIVFGDDTPAAGAAPKAAAGAAAAPAAGAAAESTFPGNDSTGSHNNNYSRPAGQNVGNFLTDRNSSRVLAPPGGASQIVFGDDVPAAKPAAPVKAAAAPPSEAAPDAAAPPSAEATAPEAPAAPAAATAAAAAAPESVMQGGKASSNNNYSRPGGQNVGNFLTDRNSSRVLAPPGGGSSIIFG